MDTGVGISLQGTLLYKDVGFKFEKGLSVVYGYNQTVAKSKNGNGAGKTFLFSQIPEILSTVPVSGTRSDRLVKGTRKLYFPLGKDKVVVEQNNSRMFLHVNNELKAKTARDAVKYLQERLCVSEEEVMSCYYLGDEGASHPLMSKSEPARKAFFSNFFQLDQIDEEKKAIAAAFRKLAYVPELLKDKQEQLAENNNDVDLKTLKQTLKELKASIKSLQEKQKGYDSARRKEQFLSANKKYLDYLAQQDIDITDKAKLKQLLQEAKQECRRLQKLIAVAENAQEAQEEYEEYLEELKQVPKLARATLKKYATKDIIANASKYDKLTYECENISDQLSVIGKKLKALGSMPKVKANPSHDVDELEEELHLTKTILRHIDKGNCPTCGSKFKSSKGKLRSKAKALQAKLDAQEAYDEDVKTAGKIKELQKEQAKLLVNLSKYKDKAEQLGKYKLAAKYAHIQKVAKPKADAKDLPSLEKQFKAAQRLSKSISVVGSNFNLVNSKTKGKDYSDKLIEMNNEYSKTYALYLMSKQQNKKRKKLLQEVTELEELDKRRSNIALLLKAYDNKAVKQMLIDQVSSMFVTELNRNTRKFLPEDFSFNFSWEAKSSLTVTRKYSKKRIVTSNISKLSGAERTLFLAALTLTLRKFKPKDKLLPILIWDEPSASLSEESFELLPSVLDRMLEDIDSIVVLTPKASEQYPNSSSYTVIKKGGDSTLVKGHPKDITDDTQSLGADQFEP